MIVTFAASRDKAFIQRQVHIRQCDAFRRARQFPATGMAFFGGQKSRLAQAPQDSANNNGIRPRMRGDVGRCLHARWISGHVTKCVQGKRQAAVALHG